MFGGDCCPVCTAKWSSRVMPDGTTACATCLSKLCPSCGFINNAAVNRSGRCAMCDRPIVAQPSSPGARRQAADDARVGRVNVVPERKPPSHTHHVDAGGAAPGYPAAAAAAAAGSLAEAVGKRPAQAAVSSPTALPQRTAAARAAAASVVVATPVSQQQQFLSEVDAARRVCREAGVIFVDPMPRDAATAKYEWAVVQLAEFPPHAARNTGGRLIAPPSSPSSAQQVGQFLLKLFSIPVSPSLQHHHQQPAPSWTLFHPQVGVHPSEILQGMLGDCWFLSAVAVLSLKHPELIRRLFVTEIANPEGVFGVQLWVDGVWELFLCGAAFPCVPSTNQFAFARSQTNSLWVSVLEKAFAMSRGGYACIQGGSPIDALYALTGMPCLTFRLEVTDAPLRGRQDGDQPTAEEIFAKLSSMADARCTMCAACGGTRATDVAANLLGLEVNHAYSVLALMNHPSTSQPIIALRNPWGRSKYAGLPSVPSPQWMIEGDAPSASFWMGYHEFLSCFSEVAVCFTNTYQTSVVVEGIEIPLRGCGGRGGPSLLTSSPPSSATAPVLFASLDVCLKKLSLLILETSEVHVMAVQPQNGRGRQQRPESSAFADVALLVVQWTASQKRWQLHSASDGRCDRVVFHTAVLPPGQYLVLPLSVSGVPLLNVNILSESPHVSLSRDGRSDVENTGGDSLAATLSIPQLLRDAAVRARKSERRRLSDQLHLIHGTLGTLHLIVAEFQSTPELRGPFGHGAGGSADVTVDFSHCQGLAICTGARPGGSAAANIRQVRLTPGSAAVVCAAAPAPHHGAFRYSFQYEARASIQLGGSSALFGIQQRLGQVFLPGRMANEEQGHGTFDVFPLVS